MYQAFVQGPVFEKNYTSFSCTSSKVGVMFCWEKPKYNLSGNVWCTHPISNSNAI